MAARLIVAAIVGGIVMFMWGFVGHAVLHLQERTFRAVTNDAEVLAAVGKGANGDGLYFVPTLPGDNATKAQMEAWIEANKGKPSAMVFFTSSMKGMEPGQLVNEGVANVVEAFVIAIVLCCSRVSFLGRVFIATLIGVVGWLSISFSYWNWYHFDSAFTLDQLVDSAVGSFLVGLAIAGIAKCAPASPAPTG